MIRPWIAAALAVAAAACGGPQGDVGDTLHRGNRMEPLSLDPHVAYIVPEMQIVSDLFVGLYQRDANGRAVPGLADTTTVSDDGLTWTFTLREAQWSDGVAISADDVVAGLRRALDPVTRNAYPDMLFVIENGQEIATGRAPVESLGAAALDPRTVELRLEYPAPFLPSVLATAGQPAPRHVIEIHGEDWIRPENIVVNGPFNLVRWESNNLIELVRNPLFYEAGTVCLDRVFYYPTTDTAAAERRVRNGELDLNPEFSGNNLAMLRERHPDLIDTSPGLTIRTLTMNTRSDITGDVRVRQALGMAVDRRFIANEVLSGADDPLFRYVPDGITGQAENIGLNYADDAIEARREQARALLEAAGYGPDNPLEFTFHYTPSAGWPRVAPVIQEDWSLIADWVRVQIAVRDSQLHYDAMRAGDFVVATSGWVGDFDDPYAYLLQFMTEAGDTNFSKWRDQAFDDAASQALRTVDLEARTQLFGQAETLLLESAADIPIFVESRKTLVGPRVRGWRTGPIPVIPSRWLCVEDG
jgi:oligopeptide transport system substrate-binding protein